MRLTSAISVAATRLHYRLKYIGYAARQSRRNAQGRMRLRWQRSLASRNPSQIRILATVCWTFPTYSHSFVYQELLQLKRAGFDVRILFGGAGDPDHLGDTFQELRACASPIAFSPRSGRRDLAHFRRTAPDRLDALLQALQAETGLSGDELLGLDDVQRAFTFARYAEDYAPDYIHSYFFYESTLFASVAAALLGRPRGVSCYADHMLADYPLKLVRFHLDRAKVIVATSARIRQELAAIHPASAPKILVKPNAINIGDWVSADRAVRAGIPTVLAVSRIDRKKGLETLIAAAGLLHARGTQLRLRILGAPDDNADAHAYHAELRQQIDAGGLRPVVDLAGMATRAEVRRALIGATVFAVPAVDLANGDKDGIPTALLEAMACSLPVVATDAGSIREVIEDGANGFCIPQRDASAMADAIARLLDASSLRAAMGHRARLTITQRFDVSVCEWAFHDAVRACVAPVAAASQ